MTPDNRFRPIRLPSQETASEQLEPKQEEAEQPKKFRRLQFGYRGVSQETKRVGQFTGGLETNVPGLFQQGLQHSAAGEVTAALQGIPPEELEPKSEGFWQEVIKDSGTLVGDAPFIGIGAMGGAILGTAAAGPIGGIVGGGAGAFALPAFLKEASREYRAFQEAGGDLTFGDYLESAGKIGSSTLREGAFGVILGQVKGGINLLRKIPAIDQLFNTRYIGPIAREATELGAEVATATTLPAAAEGRLPTPEDLAKATVLFTGLKGVHLPGQLHDAIKEARSERFNYALADKVNDMNLAYPPLQEFRKNANPVYKNSVELDRNLTAFDESYIGNIVSRINTISSNEFPSADAAGREMMNTLGPLAAIEIVPQIPGAPEPVKPVERPIPLAQNMNPIRRGGESISNSSPTKAELGRRIIRQYEQGRQAEYQPLNQRYREQEQAVTGLDFVDEALPQQIQTFIDRFEPGAIPGSQAATIVANASRLRDLFIQYDAEGNIAGYHTVPMRQVIQTNRSIKQIPNWDVPPEMLDNLGTLTRDTDTAISGQLNNVNPDLATEYQALNADYALFKNRWDNADMKPFYDRTVNNEHVADIFTKLDQFTQLAQAFEGTNAGNEVLNLIRREVWNDRFGREAIEARTEADYQAATKGLKDRDVNDVNEFLTPEQRQRTVDIMNRTNQIRTSAIRSAEQFSANRETYDRQMEQWKRQEDSRKESEKKMRNEVQMKQDLLVSLLQEDPAKLVGNMHTIEGIKRVKDATKKVTDGQKLYDSLARYETEQMFNFMGEGYIRTGRVPYTDMKLRLKDKEFRAKLKELNGEQFVKDMDQLVDLTDDLSKNFKDKQVEFKDDPTTFNTILHIYSILGLANGNVMTPLMAFTAKKSMLRMGNKAWNMWTGKRNHDQKNIHRILNAARAAKKGNKEAIRRQEALLQIPYQSSTVP